MNEFPPLPKHAIEYASYDATNELHTHLAYTTQQMRDYVEADRAQRQAEPKQTLQQAHEAWRLTLPGKSALSSETEAFVAGFKAQRRAGQQPVAWRYPKSNEHWSLYYWLDRPSEAYRDGEQPLYTAPPPAAEPVLAESFIDEFLADYEMIGESPSGADACYTPSEGERALIKDAVLGLLAAAPDAPR